MKNLKDYAQFVVIFKAVIKNPDDEYLKTSTALRKIALKTAGCLDIVSFCDNDKETTISYWLDEASLNYWQKHQQHFLAKKIGREKWYKSYEVEILKLKNSYQSKNYERVKG